jgi:hypothetical protein
VGKYVLGPYESTVVEDLKRFGYEPAEIKIVPNRLPLPEDFQSVNKTKSLRVVSVVRTRASLVVDLQNLSSQGVAVLVWGGGNTIAEGPAKPIIGAGATERFIMGSSLPEEDAEAKIDLTINGLALEDGTIEGEVATVAPLEAWCMGGNDQTRKMIAFVDQAVRGSGWRSNQELDKLCAGLEAIPVDDETPLFLLWLERYPNLAANLRGSYRQGRSFGRTGFLGTIRQYGVYNFRETSFAQWWAKYRDEGFEVLLRPEALPPAPGK